MKEQEGPRNEMKPITLFTTCSGCKYLKRTLFCSGNNPIYTNICQHESAPKDRFKSIDGRILIEEDGVIQPGDWCPFEPVNKIDLV